MLHVQYNLDYKNETCRCDLQHLPDGPVPWCPASPRTEAGDAAPALAFIPAAAAILWGRKAAATAAWALK